MHIYTLGPQSSHGDHPLAASVARMATPRTGPKWVGLRPKENKKVLKAAFPFLLTCSMSCADWVLLPQNNSRTQATTLQLELH